MKMKLKKPKLKKEFLNSVKEDKKGSKPCKNKK